MQARLLKGCESVGRLLPLLANLHFAGPFFDLLKMGGINTSVLLSIIILDNILQKI